MSSPLWHNPGGTQGRIDPVNTLATDGTYVFCLGEDVHVPVAGGGYDLPEYLFNVGDEASVQQDIDLTDIVFVRFSWHMRLSDRMPVARALAPVGNVEFRSSDLLGLGSNLQGVVLPDGASLFLETDANRLLRIAGTAHNNGDRRISHLVWNQGNVTTDPAPGQLRDGQVAILEGVIVDEVAPAASLQVLGARWHAYAMVDGIVRLDHVEYATPGYLREDLAMHVSKLVGTHSVEFVVRLELTEP